MGYTRNTRPTATRMRGIAVNTGTTIMKKTETLHQQILCVLHHLIPAHSHHVAIKLPTTTRFVRKKGREKEKIGKGIEIVKETENVNVIGKGTMKERGSVIEGSIQTTETHEKTADHLKTEDGKFAIERETEKESGMGVEHMIVSTLFTRRKRKRDSCVLVIGPSM